MHHRIVINCQFCKEERNRTIECMEITIWIDEDKKLTFHAHCSVCHGSFVLNTSAEELVKRFCHSPDGFLLTAPTYVM
jgi:hypothetical protein